jgi:hypothetical protein
MLIAKGYHVVFRKAGSTKTFKPAASYGLLHDPDGAAWPSCSGLVAPFRRSGKEIDDRLAKDYFNYDPRGGSIVIPTKTLSKWKPLGEVDGILYTRPGDKEIAGKNNLQYVHDFSNGLIFKKDFPRLYRLGRLYRIELGSGCAWTWRGIITP